MTKIEFEAAGMQVSLEIPAKKWPPRLHRDLLYRLSAKVEETIRAELAAAAEIIPSAVLTDAEIIDIHCEADVESERAEWLAGTTSAWSGP